MSGTMSAIGTKRTSINVRVMSAIGGKADMVPASRDVRFRPKADVSDHAQASISGVC